MGKVGKVVHGGVGVYLTFFCIIATSLDIVFDCSIKSLNFEFQVRIQIRCSFGQDPQPRPKKVSVKIWPT
jgi:hypothetical protein